MGWQQSQLAMTFKSEISMATIVSFSALASGNVQVIFPLNHICVFICLCSLVLMSYFSVKFIVLLAKKNIISVTFAFGNFLVCFDFRWFTLMNENCYSKQNMNFLQRQANKNCNKYILLSMYLFKLHSNTRCDFFPFFVRVVVSLDFTTAERNTHSGMYECIVSHICILDVNMFK